jgi:hypothetical protein
MPGFNAKCDNCRVTFRAHVYGFRAKRVASCPRCGQSVRGYRKPPIGYTHLIFKGMQDGPKWEPDCDYEIIYLSPITEPVLPQTPDEIWRDMLEGRISPALAEIRATRATGWPGYVRMEWKRGKPSR